MCISVCLAAKLQFVGFGFQCINSDVASGAFIWSFHLVEFSSMAKKLRHWEVVRANLFTYFFPGSFEGEH